VRFAEENRAAALRLATVGILVFPAKLFVYASSWRKKPAIKDWQDSATTDETQINIWWDKYPSAVPGIPLGRCGLVVLDADRHEGGPDGVTAYLRLKAALKIPRHPITHTAGGGTHHIFRQPSGHELGNSTGALPPGIDVRGCGGFIIGPGSMRADGAGYVEGPVSLTKAYCNGGIPEIPAALVNLINDTADADANEAPSKDVDEEMVPDGVNAQQCSMIGNLLWEGLDYAEIEQRVVDATMQMVERYKATHPKVRNWTREKEVRYVRTCLAELLKARCKELPVGTSAPNWVATNLIEAWDAIANEGGRPAIIYRGDTVLHWQVRNMAKVWAKRMPDPASSDGADSSDDAEEIDEEPTAENLNEDEPAEEANARPESPPKRPGWLKKEDEWNWGDSLPVPLAWFVKKLIPEVGIGILSGQWGAGKTFTAINLALAAATGNQLFAGRKVVKPGAVLFISLEGKEEVPIRMKAALLHAKMDPDAAYPFKQIKDTPPLLVNKRESPKAVRQLHELVEYTIADMQYRFGVPLRVIIVDMMPLITGIYDGNAAGENQICMSIFRRLSDHFKLAVVVIDQHGKDENAGVIGSIAKEYNCDFILAAFKGEDRRLQFRKVRGERSGEAVAFSMPLIAVGKDEEGLPATVPAIQWEGPCAEEGNTNSHDPGMSTEQLLALRYLNRCIAKDGKELPKGLAAPGIRGVGLETWREALVAAAVLGEDKPRNRWGRILKSLQQRGLIEVHQPWVWIPLAP
jgi:Mrp family chromosome partitioning ATPase